ncbi:LacI family transcriptional regulator [Paenibacillus sp. FSL H8-0548]|uniref:LacI family DNA-binding transcriptional regulator n=1 Tax=Paenibacillus sp. FSL H8-0548 TaxID=1920422 RepID=UPI00096DFFDF|nr:LacI family DNA-binding transcriptional regulator [Paenibacillus sp. FSL H8-0548]OMF38875.1 LacI family transcriptional regulator [Paenibacillus sp. FSL H8-0548]
MISRKEVAKLAGVSEATVSRVLNNVGPLKEETRKRVLQAAAELGYVPNALAQQFARRKSGNIGVILPFVPKVHLFSTYYFSEILSGIGETAKRCGYDLLLIFREPDGARDYAKLFRTQKIDACILLGSQNVPEERLALDELRAGGFPFCLVNQRYDEEDYLYVDADHFAGSKAAVSHLIEQGRHSIAFVNGPPQYSNSADRLDGYKSALEEAGITFKEELVYAGNYSRKSGYELAEHLAQEILAGSMDAIFAANDRMAIGLMQGLRERELHAGQHYALIGYDDSDGSRIISPRLSTVAVPFYEMGKRAAARLLESQQENEKSMLRHDILPVSLVQRETTEMTNINLK